MEVSAWTSLLGVRSGRSDVINSLVFGPSTSPTDQASNSHIASIHASTLAHIHTMGQGGSTEAPPLSLGIST